MKFRQYLIVLAMLAVVGMGTSSCSPTSLMTDEDEQRYEILYDAIGKQEKLIERKQKELEALEFEIDELMVSISEQPTEELVTALNAALSRQEQGIDELAASVSIQERQIEDIEVLEERAKNNVGGIMGMLAQFYPPLGQVSNLWLALGMFFFKRPAENAAKSVKKAGESLVHLAKRDPASAAKTLMSAARSAGGVIGLAHTTHDPNNLVSAADQLAEKKGLTKTVDPDGRVVYGMPSAGPGI